MELGNMLFGNARGEHQVDRGFQTYFHEAILSPLGCEDLDWTWPDGWVDAIGYGKTNGVFTVRPYWWGDCKCGWDCIDHELEHAEDCYQSELAWYRSRYGGENPTYEGLRTALAEWNHLEPYAGCEIHCTCDYEDRYNAWFEANKLGGLGHADDCPEVQPNFECHPLGYKLKWYKYPLRDSYSNIPTTAELLTRIASLAQSARRNKDG